MSINPPKKENEWVSDYFFQELRFYNDVCDYLSWHNLPYSYNDCKLTNIP